MLNFHRITTSTNVTFYSTTYVNGEFYHIIPVNNHWEYSFKGKILGTAVLLSEAKEACSKHDEARKQPKELVQRKIIIPVVEEGIYANS